MLDGGKGKGGGGKTLQLIGRGVDLGDLLGFWLCMHPLCSAQCCAAFIIPGIVHERRVIY